MGMLLNRVYRVIFDRHNPADSESFREHIASVGDWVHMLNRLAAKQDHWPHRNYRLQIWDDLRGWVDHSAVNSKYALFSED